MMILPLLLPLLLRAVGGLVSGFRTDSSSCGVIVDVGCRVVVVRVDCVDVVDVLVVVEASGNGGLEVVYGLVEVVVYGDDG